MRTLLQVQKEHHSKVLRSGSRKTLTGFRKNSTPGSGKTLLQGEEKLYTRVRKNSTPG